MATTSFPVMLWRPEFEFASPKRKKLATKLLSP